MPLPMNILGDAIEVRDELLSVDELYFLQDNPRVYAVTHGSIENFSDLARHEQQEQIFGRLKDEPSVKNLLPEVERHGGLLEPILVRWDTREVIEGNSRLAVYRTLRDSAPEDDRWKAIPSRVVSSLTEEQQVALLNLIHVKGKTNWSAYEKANFAYVRYSRDWTYKRIADLFGESIGTIRTRVRVVQLMRECGESDRRRFSYYDVMVRTDPIAQEIQNQESELRRALASQIQEVDPDADKGPFTAQELRQKLPVVMKKRKVLKRFVGGVIDLEEAYDRARVSQAEERVKKALAHVESIEKGDVSRLDQNARNALRQAVKKLNRGVDRVRRILEQAP